MDDFIADLEVTPYMIQSNNLFLHNRSLFTGLLLFVLVTSRRARHERTTFTTLCSRSTGSQADQIDSNLFALVQTGYNLGLTDKGKAYWVHLTARNPKNSVPEIYILIDKKTSHPETIKMRRGKEWTTVTVRNFKAGRLADSVFTFNAKEFPHAEVVDLR